MKNAGVRFPGIGLTRDVKDRDIPQFMSNVSFQCLGFFRISFKQLQKTGLGACSAPATQQLYGGKQGVQILQILQKILRPAGGPAAYGQQVELPANG